MTFGIGTFSDDSGTYAGLLVAGRVHDLRPHMGHETTTLQMLQDWPTSLERIHVVEASIDQSEGVPSTEVRAMPPVQPGQLICAGANYYRHTIEMTEALLASTRSHELTVDEIHREALATTQRAARSGTPFVFAGLTGALCGANDDVVLWGPGAQHDWEVEVAVVIGRAATAVSAAEAMDYVAGYTICNDVSTRDVMFRPGFALTDFIASKSRPTFFPLGPAIVPAEFVPDYRKLRLRLAVNGETMQDDTMGDIIYGVEDLIAYLSSLTTLQPGDVVLTGTPGGNAASHGGRWLKSGDHIESYVDGLGSQSNRCVAEPSRTS